MIYVTGDLHGSMNRVIKFNEMIKGIEEPVVLLVAGDFGIWDERGLVELRGVFARLRPNLTVAFVDGNHENFDLLEEYIPITHWGGKVRRIFPNLYHLMRGEVYTILGRKVLAFGGATSIDKKWRNPGSSWWPQEHWSQHDLNRLEELIGDPDLEVDIILTHEAPKEIFNQIKRYSNKVNDFIPTGLQLILDTIPFKLWYFGHHHLDFEVETNNDYKIFGVYGDIRKVE